MANLEKRLPENVPGDFFVDSTCIDCDACRQIAPAVFGDAPPVVTHLVAGVHINEKHNEGE